MTARDWIAAGLYLVPSLLWTVIARQLWQTSLHRRGHSRAFRLLPIVATVLAVHYFLLLGRALTPGATPTDVMSVVRTPWHATAEVTWLLAIALLRHLLMLLPMPEQRPRPLWLAVNYGIALGAAAVALALRVWPGATIAHQEAAHRVFELGFTVLAVLCLVQFVRNARPGVWGPEHAGEMRRSDVVLVTAGAAAAFLLMPVVWLAGGQSLAIVVYEVVLGLAVAAPMVTRMAGWVLPELVVALVLVAATAGIFVMHGIGVRQVSDDYRPLVTVAGALAALGVIGGGALPLREAVTRGLLRRRRHAAQELRSFLHTLSPELGVAECCRRALAEVARVRELPGAAIVLADGQVVVHGSFHTEPLRRVWPRGPAAAALPAGAYGSAELRDLPQPLREALVEANVGLGAAAIRSPRRHWGHLFMQAGFLAGMFREDDAVEVASFVDQLALVLDAADLIARTVAVERSLAHAEKLAAIGELAARFAHDIRNPVTAARSLAQQLARDPTAPENAEYAGIILEELERVERQVRDHLRFARREDCRLEPLDLGRLVAETAHDLRTRCEALGVTLAVDARDGVLVQGDRERLRQVLINLIENACDALADAPTRMVRLALASEDGTVTLAVTDSGAGVPRDVLPRLFEPFYTQKPHGTGLGLAIAKRTIEAHGGRIDGSVAEGGGMIFRIALPAA
jgi:signal transduction histidine kinase